MDIVPLQNDLNKSARPVLLLIRGMPGSGKSYLAAELLSTLDANRVEMLDPDAIDLQGDEFSKFSSELSSQGLDVKFHPYRYLRGKAYAAIEAGKIIIWNQPFTNYEGFKLTIDRLQAHASASGVNMEILLVEVELDVDLARSRVVSRQQGGGHGMSDASFARFVAEYESFAGRGIDTIVVNGTDPVSVSAVAVRKALDGKL